MGGRLDALQAGEHGGLPHLEVVDAHEHVAVAGQRAAVAVVDLPALGPVLDDEGQLEQAPVHLRVVPQQLGVHDRQDVVHRDVHLCRHAPSLDPKPTSSGGIRLLETTGQAMEGPDLTQPSSQWQS